MPVLTADTRGILNPHEGATHFTLTRHAPSPEIADRVERHWIVTWDLRGRSPYTQDVLPHPCVNLVFEGGERGGAGRAERGGTGRPSRGRVYGLVRTTFSRRLEGTGMAVGTKFRPGAFAAYVDVPMTRLVGRSLALTEAFGPHATRLERDVSKAGDVDDQVAAVERFIADRAPGPDPGFELVSAVIADMLIAPPGMKVDELAARHGLSARTLQRLFRRYVGLGPKWVLQRYRLHEAAERMAAGEADDLTRLALDLGYFDLAHFTGHFRKAVGRSPAAFMRACAAA
ncbi:MAG TPA: helix-turn-helix domain-containing protein [Solirubrobacteraceae bacterium]